jgi:predicted nucleotidyltransferase
LLDLSHRADLNWLADVLGDARQAAPSADWLLVGAMARDLWLSYAHGIRIDRETTDVDLAVGVAGWENFHATQEQLLGGGQFVSVGALQRLRHRSGRLLDLVPFGGIEDSERRIAWPPSGDMRMNVMGCREARASAAVLRLRTGVESQVITLPGLIVLKFFAFADRALTQPRKDAYDLHLVLSHYLEAGNESRLYDEHADLLEMDRFDFTVAGAAVAGRDVRRLLVAHSATPDQVIAAIDETLATELNVGGSNRLLGQVPLQHAETFRQLLLAFQHELLRS